MTERAAIIFTKKTPHILNQNWYNFSQTSRTFNTCRIIKKTFILEISVTHTCFTHLSITDYTAKTQTQKNSNLFELVEDNTSNALKMHVPCSYGTKWYDEFHIDAESPLKARICLFIFSSLSFFKKCYMIKELLRLK